MLREWRFWALRYTERLARWVQLLPAACLLTLMTEWWPQFTETLIMHRKTLINAVSCITTGNEPRNASSLMRTNQLSCTGCCACTLQLQQTPFSENPLEHFECQLSCISNGEMHLKPYFSGYSIERNLWYLLYSQFVYILIYKGISLMRLNTWFSSTFKDQLTSVVTKCHH